MNEFCPFMSKGTKENETVKCSENCKLYISKGSTYAKDSFAVPTCAFIVLVNDTYRLQQKTEKLNINNNNLVVELGK